MRKFLIWLVSGAFGGVLIATFAAPWVLEKLLASTGAKDAMCQCTELVNNTASLLITTLGWGAVAGGVLGLIGAGLTRGHPSAGAGDSAAVAAPPETR
jgi:hypothetical protein